MSQPFFSIIIPVLNGQSQIDACLASILNQNFQQFEILFVDGFSTDGTVEKINAYKQTSDKIHLFQVKSKIYEAMNYGIAQTKGHYLYFMGCDDALYNNQVLTDVAAQIDRANKPDFIYGNVLLAQTNLLHNGEYDLRKLYYLNICHQSIFYAKEVFTKVGTFDPSYPSLADWHFNFRCFSDKRLKISYMNLLIAVYALAGFSSKNPDPLIDKKREVFLSLAHGAETAEYLKLRRSTVDTNTFFGKMAYVYYHLLYSFFFLFKSK